MRIRAQRTSVRSSVALLTVALAAGFLGGATVTGAEAANGSSLARGIPTDRLNAAALAGKVSNPLREANGAVTAFVELASPAGIDTYSARRDGGATIGSAKAAARETKSAVGALVDNVLGTLRSLDGATDELFRTSNAVAGFAVTADAAQLRRLASRDDVRSVRTMTPKKQTNVDAVQLTKTLNAWQQTGKFGDGVKLGIVDTGIDYTHADFGGPGTVEAYTGVDRTVDSTELFPSAKVAGGTDFAGDDYDAGTPGQDTPKPDPNPLSCENDHGSHVAGTAGGFGVTAEGRTFTGDYSKLTPEQVRSMRIGPGTAPKATLYAYKVFGCTGSTNLTSQALDASLDPNGDGDFSDRMDVVNLSLGGDFGAPDDPDSLFVRKLAQNDVLPVFSAGNAGDVYDTGGSPGSSLEALTVASTKDRGVLRDGLKVNQPSNVAGISAGQFSVEYAKPDAVTGAVVRLGEANVDGCDPLSAADKAKVQGKVAWLYWDDNDGARRCGSAGRTDNVTEGGAIGAVFTSTLEQFPAGIGGNAEIPAFQLTGSQTDKLRPALNAGSLNVTLDPALRTTVPTSDPSIEDTPSGFTSRGVRGPSVKPDVAAPGDTISSVLSASGTGRKTISGTSMAAPHTAGIAALVSQANPTWTAEEVKAAVMNTAGADVYSGPNRTGRIMAPQRVGSGRVDAAAALGNKVLAMNAENKNAVSVSFGTVEVSQPVSRSKAIRLVNKGDRAVSFNAAYTGITKLPGVSYSLSQRAVRVPAGDEAVVRITMRISDPSALRKLIDPSMSKKQLDLERQFLADASGRVVFTPTSGSTTKLRVPVYSAPKPVAAISTPNTVTVPNGQTTAPLGFSGRGLNQGSGDAAYRSLASVLQLGTTSPRLPECSGTVTTECTINGTATAGDLRYVGALSTAPDSNAQENALLGIGIGTWGDWYNIGSNTIPFVDIDTTGDGKPDFEIVVGKLTDGVDAQDILVASTFDLNSESTEPVDIQPINGQLGDVDTNTFDTNVLVAPVLLSALGIDPAADSAPITYTVGVDGFYTAPGAAEGAGIDSAGPVSYDPLNPALYASGSGAAPGLSYVAQPGTRLTVHRDAAAAAEQEATGLLVLNHHNAKGNRGKVIPVDGANPARQAGNGQGARQQQGG